MFRTLVALSLLAAPGALMAQTSGNTRTLAQAQAAHPEPTPELAQSSAPPQRVRSVTVTGTQACPKSTGDEVVVCSRVDRDEQYRIPPKMRELPHPAANNSWVNRAAMIDEVGREAGGLPDTCSVVGSGGQTGCAAKAARQYSAEKRQAQREQESIP